jgi:hypothetical protein
MRRESVALIRPLLARCCAHHRFLLRAILRGQLVGDVVLVNIADVSDGLLADVFGYFELYIAEPDVWVETVCGGLFAQARDTIGPRVVTGRVLFFWSMAGSLK